MLVLAPLLSACAIEPPDQTLPTAPSFELFDERQVMDARRVNVSVRGTFQVLSGDPPRVLGVGGVAEPANFPGHPPAGPGTCIDGHWFNAKGKGTSGSIDHPHPHCFDPGSEGITIVLEPISSQLIATTEPTSTTLVLSNLDDVYVHHSELSGSCRTRPCYENGGWGGVVGYAVDSETGARVGILKFTLALKLAKESPFDCSLDGDREQTGCINFIYTANYAPLPPEMGGQGTEQQVSGFLYWIAAN
jgi:hypothetical protein